jgi:FkbM family methyltransferase
MSQALKQFVKQTLRHFDVVVTSSRNFNDNVKNSRASEDLRLLQALPEQHAAQLLKTLPKSKAQYRQDLFVLSELGFKRDGYFVEFGATNGVDINNTWLLEKEFGWNGILAEPARCWHEALRSNRRCKIETNCVWRETDATLVFNEVDRADLSTIHAHSNDDDWRKVRKLGKTYEVTTISLTDMLVKHGAPSKIDYLSIDTEGSEFEILSALDFDRFSFNVITCEHNYTPYREKIHTLLTSKGYRRKFESYSQYDDWYVKA